MGKARRRAVATAHAAALPQYQAIRRDKREARRSLGMGRRANRQGYDVLDRKLEEIGNDYRGDYRRLNTGYRQGVTGLGSMLNVAGGGEGTVGAGAFGGVAASGIRGLGQQRSRGIEYTRSTRTQAGIEQRTNDQNLLDAFQAELKELQNRRHDVAAQESANIASLTPQYAAQIAEQRLAEEEAARAEELAAWYMEQLKAEQERRRLARLTQPTYPTAWGSDLQTVQGMHGGGMGL